MGLSRDEKLKIDLKLQEPLTGSGQVQGATCLWAKGTGIKRFLGVVLCYDTGFHT